MRDKVWFFGAIRRALSSSGISRTAVEVARLEVLSGRPGSSTTTRESWQPYVKLTSRLGSHEVQGFYQRDRLLLTGDREYNYEPINVQSTGGALYGGKVTSVWGASVTTTFSASYNNKGGTDATTFEALGLTRSADHHPPERHAVRAARCNGTRPRSSRAATCSAYNYQPASQIILRGDLTYFKDGWFGNHEFQTGFFCAPRNTYDHDTLYVNDGFVLEEQRLRDINNPAARHDSVPPPLSDAGRLDDAPGARTATSPSTCRTHWRPNSASDAEPRRPRSTGSGATTSSSTSSGRTAPSSARASASPTW